MQWSGITDTKKAVSTSGRLSRHEILSQALGRFEIVLDASRSRVQASEGRAEGVLREQSTEETFEEYIEKAAVEHRPLEQLEHSE